MLEIGQLLDNKYRILDVIGRGGMSVVYLARNEKANKSWAVKEIRKIGEENLEIKKNSLIAETNILKNLSNKHLPAIVDVIETEDTYQVVMDYIEGNDLGKMLKDSGAQPSERVVEWGKQLCDVLGYLHSREKPIIYRDLKPDNIMLKPDGNIVLIDFGTAREVKIEGQNDTTSLGTRGYAAPEQFGKNAHTDARTDIYCLGTTMYHLVTNHIPPYVIESVRDINPSVSKGLEQIIIKCTQIDPNERYQSCAELMYAFDNIDLIDEEHRKKQKKKISIFMTSVAMMLVSVFVAIFGYVNAQSVKAQNIDTYIAEANKETNTKADREKAYEQAILLDYGNKDFYEGLLQLYLSYSDVGDAEENKLSVIEVTKLDALSLPNGNNISPLAEFSRINKSDYEDFCKKTGLACWYYYNSSTKPKTKASEWFKRYIDSVGEENTNDAEFVKVYYSIGQCVNKSEARIEEKKKQCEEIWKLINNLDEMCSETEEREAVILGSKEIINEINDYCEYFSVMDSIKSQDLITKVTNIKNRIDKIYNQSDIYIKKLIDEQFMTINALGIRIEREGYFDTIINKIENNYRSDKK